MIIKKVKQSLCRDVIDWGAELESGLLTYLHWLVIYYTTRFYAQRIYPYVLIGLPSRWLQQNKVNIIKLYIAYHYVTSELINIMSLVERCWIHVSRCDNKFFKITCCVSVSTWQNKSCNSSNVVFHWLKAVQVQDTDLHSLLQLLCYRNICDQRYNRTVLDVMDVLLGKHISSNSSFTLCVSVFFYARQDLLLLGLCYPNLLTLIG